MKASLLLILFASCAPFTAPESLPEVLPTTEAVSDPIPPAEAYSIMGPFYALDARLQVIEGLQKHQPELMKLMEQDPRYLTEVRDLRAMWELRHNYLKVVFTPATSTSTEDKLFMLDFFKRLGLFLGELE